MKPEDYRQLTLKIGTPVSLAGEYGGPSTWSEGILEGKLYCYLVVERDFTLWMDDKSKSVWDTGAIVALERPLAMTGFHGEAYQGIQLLLLHRHPNTAWDNSDPDVHVYGIKQNESLEKGPLSISQWRLKTVLLAGTCTMSVDDPLSPSLISTLRKEKHAHRQT